MHAHLLSTSEVPCHLVYNPDSHMSSHFGFIVRYTQNECIMPTCLFNTSVPPLDLSRLDILANPDSYPSSKSASTIKWITLDPCSNLNESDPKLYTNFEFYEIEIHKHLENICIYKAKQFMFTNKQFQTTYIYCTGRCK